MKEGNPILKAIFFPAVLTAIFWTLQVINWSTNGSLGFFGTYPRHIDHWFGIFTGAFIHGSWEHLISNTPPFFILASLIFLSYKRIAFPVILIIYLLTGISIFLFARDSFHIGVSGVIYGFATFLFSMGFFRHDVRSMALTAIVGIFYGGMVWGVLPMQPGISWEGHLFGGIAGVFCAYIYRNHNKEIHASPDEPEDEEKSFHGFLNRNETDNLEEKIENKPTSQDEFFKKLDDKYGD